MYPEFKEYITPTVWPIGINHSSLSENKQALEKRSNTHVQHVVIRLVKSALIILAQEAVPLLPGERGLGPRLQQISLN